MKKSSNPLRPADRLKVPRQQGEQSPAQRSCNFLEVSFGFDEERALAVSRAQNETRDLMKALEERGGEVKFAIHSVAGRMPGHMNVLLAEADIPYDKLVDMEVINPELPRTTVAVVLGANDVVNPAARTDKSSPLYGMPIIDVDRAEHVIVIKRSLAPGFAGVDNDLFYMPKTRMFFADGKDALTRILQELKSV